MTSARQSKGQRRQPPDGFSKAVGSSGRAAAAQAPYAKVSTIFLTMRGPVLRSRVGGLLGRVCGASAADHGVER